MFGLRKLLISTDNRIIYPAHKRNFCKVVPSTCVLEQLNKKSLITVFGEEAPAYLQGLVTNDINHLFNNYSSIFAMFLNSKGRVLYDTIIYKIDPKTYLVECDSTLVQTLEKHLKMYKLRRKVDVFISDYRIHALFDKQYCEEVLKNKGGSVEPSQNFDIDLSSFNNTHSVKIFKDPRVSQLGYRILSQEGTDLPSELSSSVNLLVDCDSFSYKKQRYAFGIGEGPTDLPSGSSFPLESNCDYLHGVSFHKGCYIGQELTARTYHTGVTRKRLMPLYFSEAPERLPSEDLVSDDNVKLGKLRGLEGNVGLALVRLESVRVSCSFAIGGKEVVAGKPFWWPIEAPKEIKGLKN